MQIISETKAHLVDVTLLPPRTAVCLSIQKDAAQTLENDSFLQPSIFPGSRFDLDMKCQRVPTQTPQLQFYGTKRVRYIKTTGYLHLELCSTN